MTSRRKLTHRSNRVPVCASVLAICAAFPGAAFADTVIFSSRNNNATCATSITAAPLYQEIRGNWDCSSLKSTAVGTPTRAGSRYTPNTATITIFDPAFSISPTLGQAGGSYKVYITHGSASSVNTPNVFISVTGGTGLPASTGVFTSAGANTWEEVGTLTLDAGVTNPTITFTRDSTQGTYNTSNRFYADAFKFVNTADLCATVADVNPTGPLSAGQTYVNVQDVSGSASSVNVYADGTLIGTASGTFTVATYHPTGKTLVQVPTSALVKGKSITATQVIGGQEGCLPPPLSGLVVGSGTNPPKVRVSLSVREDTALTGPINASSNTSSTTVVWLGATGVLAGFGTAPAGVPTGKQIAPGLCWQTVSWRRDADAGNPAETADPIYEWAGSNNQTLEGNFGQLDGLGLSISNSDDGAYMIFVDEIMNGNVILADFESFTAGAGRPAPDGTATSTPYFHQPSFSGTTTPFLSPLIGPVWPNFTYIPDAAYVPATPNEPAFQFGAGYADRGTKAAALHFQFVGETSGNWLRTVVNSPVQVDLRQTISARLLVLPVNASTPNTPMPQGSPLPSISAQPQNKTVTNGGTAGFSVTTSGAGTLTYQWLKNGAKLIDSPPAVSGATTANLTLSNVQLDPLPVHFYGANWTDATLQITGTNKFVNLNASEAAGATLVITAGPTGGVVLGNYTVASKVNDSTITLTSDINGGFGDVTANDINGYVIPVVNETHYAISVEVCDAARGSTHSVDADLKVVGCNTPSSDFDGDTDVDDEDFGFFQSCIDPTQVPAGCKCADLNSDGKVDSNDFGDPGNIQPNTFLSCASRAFVKSTCAP